MFDPQGKTPGNKPGGDGVSTGRRIFWVVATCVGLYLIGSGLYGLITSS